MAIVSLDDFDLEDRVRTIFIGQDWESDEELIANLEMYKFVNRDRIIEVLKSKGIKSLVNLDRVAPIPKDSRLKENLERIQMEHGVLVEQTGHDSVRFISNIFNQQQTHVISVKANVTNIEIVYVTPHNFAMLSNKIPNWDYIVLLKRIVLDSIEKKGRDIHFGVRSLPEETVYHVSFRIAADVEECELFKFNKEMNAGIIKDLISKQTSGYEGDLDSSYGAVAGVKDLFSDGEVELRVSANAVYQGYRCVCRIQQMSTTTLGINQLGFNEEIQQDLHKINNKQHGLTLVTGGMNTGKNTTMFAIANEMNKRPIAIIDYSSPIETRMGFDQVDYQNDPLRLRQLTRLAKKQDLDVILMSELPDVEVANEAKDLVNSSVHVMTTMHINRIWHLPYKIEQFFSPNFKDIYFQLNGCFNQKMYKVQCPHCKKDAHISGLKEEYKNILKQFGVEYYFESAGCDRCQGENKEVKIQPYMERLMFNERILERLMSVERSYEMAGIIKEEVMNKNHHLEYQLSMAIKEGKLEVSSLESIL